MNPYIPNKLPLDSIDWVSLITKIGEANRAVANFNGILNGLHNKDLLLSPLMNNEAVLSNKIEGTQVDTIELLRYEAGIEEKSEEKKNDIGEVINYRYAMKYGAEELSKRNMSLYMIKELHRLLLNNVRGATKSPGEIRKVQNYIGSIGSSVENARFVPPDPIVVPEYMDNLVDYMNFYDKDILVQAAVLHAQFEIIHPFCDGNGRLGRMLVPLFLYQKKIISSPVLYISQYFNQNEMAYKNSLKTITDENNWTQWISFFLDAIKWQAERNYRVATNIIRYYDKTKESIVKITTSQHAVLLLDAMIAMPIFRQNSLKLISNPTKATIYTLIQKLNDAGIITLIEKGSGRAGSVYCLKELLDIAESNE